MDPPRARSSLEGGSVLSLCPGADPVGRPDWVSLRYVGAADGPYVLAAGLDLPDWARKLERAPVARWRIAGAEFRGTAERLAEGEPTYRTILGRFESRFGAGRLEQWFGGHAVGFRLVCVPAVKLSAPASVEAFFDAAAAEYDRLVMQNPLDAWLREESVAFLEDTFRDGQRVLELGCGTGLETIPLAEAGVEVVAIDVSSGMLRRLEEKARSRGLSSRIHVRKMPASGLEPVLAEYGGGSFDGAFSDFGALNLDAGWSKVPGFLSDLVRPDGALVLGIWNRVCLMEMVLYALALRPSRALSRLRSPVPPGLSRFAVPVTAHAPGPFLATFEPAFRLELLAALPVLVPPYDFLPHMPAPDRILPLIESADRRVRGLFPFNRLGDHFLARMRRTGA